MLMFRQLNTSDSSCPAFITFPVTSTVMSIEIVHMKLFRAGVSRNLSDSIYEKPLLNYKTACHTIQQKCALENKDALVSS